MAGVIPHLQSMFKSLSGSQSKEQQEDEIQYTGYKLVTAADLPYDEDLPKNTRLGKREINPAFLQDKGKTSKSLLLSIILFTISFIAMLVWQILIAECKVDTLCETIDDSSRATSSYLFKTLLFRVPSAVVWSGLPAGSLGLLFALTYSFLLLRKDVGPAKAVEMATILRKGSSALLSQQYVVMVGPILIALIVLGVTINWNTAGCFALGALICINASQVGVSILTRGNTRTSGAAQNGLRESFRLALRTGSVVCVSVIGMAVLGLSGTYLMFTDIRALSGLAAGASSVALLVRMSSAIFNRAASDTLDMLQVREHSDIVSDARDNPNVAVCVGSGVGKVSGLGSDMFSSVIIAVTATAILGSSLPFYYRDKFALCVFNHLGIDQACGPFGYPEKLSYATYICSNDNFYLQYPTLKTWGSNSAFVALPFALASVGLLVSVVATLYFHSAKASATTLRNVSDVSATVRRLARSIALNVGVGYFLILVGAAAVCFGIFGSSSEFQQYDGFGNGNGLAKMELDGSSTQCVSKFLDGNVNSGLTPFPVPQGGSIKATDYTPVTISGTALGKARYTPWRLFLCTVIGIALSFILIVFNVSIFRADLKGPVKRLYRAVQCSPSTGIVHSIASGLLYSAIPSLCIATSIVLSHKLYGPYGIGLGAVAFLSSGGFLLSCSAMGYVATSANDVAWASNLSEVTRTNTGILGIFGSVVNAAATEVANAGSALSVTAMLFVIAEQSGIIPSPRNLIGSKEVPPVRLIDSVYPVSFSDPFVLVSVILGASMPFVIAGLLILGSNRATECVFWECCRQKVSSRARRKQNYAQFFSRVSRTALMESAVPMWISIMIPLAIGFGFGQAALVGLLAAVVASGFILGTMLTITSGFWSAVAQHLASILIVQPLSGGKRGRLSSQITDFWETAGPSLQVVTKAATSISLVMVTLMQKDRSRGWIGGVIVVATIVTLGLFVVAKRYRASLIKSGVEKEDITQAGAPPKRVSPFYADGHAIDPVTVRPGSQAHDALQAIGNPAVPISADLLPGLSDRSTTNLGGCVEGFVSPRRALPTSPVVFRDEVRDTTGNRV